MDQVPRDVLADVLALLPPRALAVSRCVCREWRDVVDADARCHLRTDLLPVSVAGIFVMTNEAPPEFFVRPSMAHKIAGDLQSYTEMDHYYYRASIVDCCNGLILLSDHVVNPATRQWMRLPRYPILPEEKQRWSRQWYHYDSYLVFDPTVSPHFEVFSMKDPLGYKDELSEESEWPPLEYVVRVYSSKTQRWEERPFLREEEHTTTDANVWSKLDYGCWHGVYCHGALYVYWKLTFITRITVSNNKYQVINLPTDVINSTTYHQFHLGKSVNGAHFAVAGDQGLQVWFLDESDSKTEWVLKHVTSFPFSNDQIQTDRPWILQDGHYYTYNDDDQEENNKEPTAAEKDSDWDSDADNATNIDLERVEEDPCPYFEVLGFHPYRDIVLLVLLREVVAYYFNRSKVQHLGDLLTRYIYQEIWEGFIYTPSWVGELPGANYLVRKRNSYSIVD